jgi:hypothetical protein
VPSRRRIVGDWNDVSRVICALALLVLLTLVAGAAARDEQRFAVLQTSQGTLTNVVVTGTTTDRVFVRHAQGIATLKVSELAPEIRRELGFNIVEEKKLAKAAAKGESPAAAPATQEATRETTESAGWLAPARVERIRELWSAFRGGYIAAFFKASDVADPGGNRLAAHWRIVIAGAVSMILYFYYCFTLWQLCEKSNGQGSRLVFLPGLRWIPLFQAANMSAQCFLIPLVQFVAIVCPPPINSSIGFIIYLGFVALATLASIVLHGVWSVRICTTFNRSPWLGLLMFFPVTNMVGLSYLAFAGHKEEVAPAPEFKTAPVA